MGEAEQDGASTDGAGVISTRQRLDSIEVRLAALESAQAWLRLEQLQAELASLHAVIEYIVERDGGSVV